MIRINVSKKVGHYLLWGGILNSILFAGVSEAATYYVGKTGSNSYTCFQAQSQSTPRLTIGSGLACLSSGDTLLIKAGTYTEAINNQVPSGTSWTSPTTVARFGSDVVVLAPSGATHVINLSNGSAYIVIDGLILDGTNCQYDGLVLQWSGSDFNTAAHHIRIQNCEIRNAFGQGVSVNGNSHHCEIINCKIYNNGRTDLDHGIYWKGAYGLIDGCEIYRNSGWGVSVYNGVVQYGGAYPTDYVVVRNNYVHDNARVGTRGPGIGLYSGTGSVAYNNVIVGNNGGFEVDYGAINAAVYSNTIYNNKAGTYPGVRVGSGSTGVIIKNNIIYLNNESLSNTGSGTVQSNNSTSDPLFVDPIAANFRVRSGSPAIDAGVDLSPLFRDDYSRMARPQGVTWDLGAYEYGTSSGSTTTPPSNLRIASSN